jgi:predicted metalloprotease with PDZ domain
VKLEYLLVIEDPHKHMAKVVIKGRRSNDMNQLRFFLPAWCPGSYMIRDYARHIVSLQAMQGNGEVLHCIKETKSTWVIDWDKSELSNQGLDFELVYQIYCFQISVRSSYIDVSHAFINGPGTFMGLVDHPVEEPTLEVVFPQLWSKISTSLEDISPTRDVFLFKADDYDSFIDCPLEIGCHDTDGFMHGGVPFELAFYGRVLQHKNQLKADIKRIVEYISTLWGNIPFDKYCFISHFLRNQFGGLEHGNSSVLIFDSALLGKRKEYLDYLSLVAHEYFHAWNIKKIRPIELGPFDYQKENYTTLLWLVEGLTTYMDDLIVFRTGIGQLEEYLEIIKNTLKKYDKNAGKRFQTLEEASFDAWIKLYNIDENFKNSNVCYYSKGKLVFMALHILFFEKGVPFSEFLKALWNLHQGRPSVGIKSEEVFQIVEGLAGVEVCDEFTRMISTTEDIDFDFLFKKIGINIKRAPGASVSIGASVHIKDSCRVFVKEVELDGSAFKAGLNPGDEIIGVDGVRILAEDLKIFPDCLGVDTRVRFQVSRAGQLMEVDTITEAEGLVVQGLEVLDQNLVTNCFMN